jgi:hypothetical protein
MGLHESDYSNGSELLFSYNWVAKKNLRFLAILLRLSNEMASSVSQIQRFNSFEMQKSE